MSDIGFESELSSAVANSVFLLKTETDTVTGIIMLQNGGDANKYITNLQEHLFELRDIIGMVNESDPNAKIYATNNIVANGDNQKVTIEKFDVGMKLNLDNIASNLLLITQNTNDIADIIAALGVDSVTSPLAVGIATLDSDGKVPLSQIPNSLLQYQGTWDADTNTPTLANTDTGVENYWYRVNVAGTTDFGAGNITFAVGDKVVNNGTVWEKWDTNDEVTSVFSRTGDVVAMTGDYTPTQVGLGNVTDDAQLKRAAGDINTFTEKVTLVEDDIVIIEDSEDSFNKKKAKLSNLLGGGGGGGGSFQWQDGDIAPLSSVFKGMDLKDFDGESEQEIYALVTVPSNYTAGNQIGLVNAKFFSAGAADNVLYKCEVSLVKTGDDVTAAFNTHLSSNTELTLTTASELLEIGDMDLTDGSGEINAVAVAALDILILRLYRDNTNETASSTEDARFLIYSANVEFDL